MEKLSGTPKEQVIGRSLTSVCLLWPIYIDMLNSAIHKGAESVCSTGCISLYCSKNEKNPSRIRQNMIVNSIYVNGESYAMIQIMI